MTPRLLARLRAAAADRTLRRRVSTLAVIVIMAWLIVLAVVFDVVIANRLDTQVDDALRVRGEAASATVVVSGGRVTGVRDSATDAALDASIWVFSGTRVVERAEGRRAQQDEAQALAGAAPGFHEAGDERFYVLPVLDGAQRIGTVVAAIDREPYDHTRDVVVVGSVLVVVLGAVGAYPVLALATRRALQPVDDMTRQAARWSVSDPGQRFGAGQQFTELASLAHTLDELLDRLAAVLRHEQQLSAELSHELRTPLSRVTGEVELLLFTAQGQERERLASVYEDCRAMDTLIDTLLATARGELVGVVGRSALQPVLAALAATDPRARAEPTDLHVGVDAEVVVRMLSPVLDNARRHARTQITMRARRAGSAVTVELANDGPPVAPEVASRLFEPGVTTSDSGAGLGLPLARRLARAADGELELVAGAPSVTFRLTLPPG